MMDAWICRPARALVLRIDLEPDHPLLLSLSPGPATPAIGGLDLITPNAVVGLRVMCDGIMTYASGRLRLDMATWAVLLLGTSPDRQELDDRLCALAVALDRPGGYDTLRHNAHPAMTPT